MLGLRYALLQPDQQAWLTDGTLDWLWPAAEQAGLPIAFMAGALPAGVRAASPSAIPAAS